MKFSIIVADPPWFFLDELKMSDVARSAQANYNTMSIAQIKALPIKEITDPDGAILALWVPSCLLQEGLDVMKAWGFTHKQTYIWVKTKKNPLAKLITSLKPKKFSDIKDFKTYLKSIFENISLFDLFSVLGFGLGRLYRQTHEVCLIGINNKKVYKNLKNKSQRSVSFAPNLKHSAKPEHLQNSLEVMFPYSNKLEMFARRVRPDWVCIGNEVCNGEDITLSLAKLISNIP